MSKKFMNLITISLILFAFISIQLSFTKGLKKIAGTPNKP